MVASTANGIIILFLQMNNSIGCISSKKRVIPNSDNKDLVKCEDCNSIPIVSSCATQWFSDHCFVKGLSKKIWSTRKIQLFVR